MRAFSTTSETIRSKARQILEQNQRLTERISTLSQDRASVIQLNDDSINIVVDMASRLSRFPDTVLSSSALSNIETALNSFLDGITTLASVTNDDTLGNIELKLKIIRDDDGFANLYQVLLPYISIADTSIAYGIASKAHEDLHTSISPKIAESDEIIAQLQNQLVEANQLLDAARANAGKTTISVYADVYEKQAKKHKLSFAISGIALVGLTSVVSYYFNNSLTRALSAADIKTWIDLTKTVYPHLPAAVFAATLLILLVRVFLAERHNMLICEHKSLALRTFQTYAASADNPKLRDIILTQTTAAVFSISGTGYLKLPVELAAGPVKFSTIGSEDV